MCLGDHKIVGVLVFSLSSANDLAWLKTPGTSIRQTADVPVAIGPVSSVPRCHERTEILACGGSYPAINHLSDLGMIDDGHLH